MVWWPTRSGQEPALNANSKTNWINDHLPDAIQHDAFGTECVGFANVEQRDACDRYLRHRG
eukprot:796326-Heterocapsa_arctica.AAC.1